MITPEELKYYTALQPFFKEKMGGWEVGDKLQTSGSFYIPNRHFTVISEIEKRLHPDLIVVDDYGNRYVIGIHYKDPDILRLPLPIDPADDERKKRGENPRGLWGMVDWKKWVAVAQENGDLVIQMGQHPGVNERFENTPALALLRALCTQENIVLDK